MFIFWKTWPLKIGRAPKRSYSNHLWGSHQRSHFRQGDLKGCVLAGRGEQRPFGKRKSHGCLLFGVKTMVFFGRMSHDSRKKRCVSSSKRFSTCIKIQVWVKYQMYHAAFGLRKMPPLFYLCCASCTLTQPWRFLLLYEQRHLQKESKGSMFQPAMFTYQRTSKSHNYLICLCVCVGCVLCPTKTVDVFHVKKWNPKKSHRNSHLEPCRSSLRPRSAEPRKDFFRTISRWVWMPTWHLGSLGQVGTRKTDFSPKYGNDLNWKEFRCHRFMGEKHICVIIDDH